MNLNCNGTTPRPPLNTVSDGAADRQANGRFAPGNHASHGNPFTRKLAELRQAFVDVVDAGKLKQLADRLYNLAMDGDIPAAKLVLAYSLGRPAKVQNPDRLDIAELELLTQFPTTADIFLGLDRHHAATAAALLRDLSSEEKAPDKIKQALKIIDDRDLENPYAILRNYLLHRMVERAKRENLNHEGLP